MVKLSSNLIIKILRWTARFLGVAIMFFFWDLAITEHGLRSLPELHLTRDMLPLNWMITMVSYVFAWKWERSCGIIILVMYFIHGLLDPTAFVEPLWIVMAIPGILFIIVSEYGKTESDIK